MTDASYIARRDNGKIYGRGTRDVSGGYRASEPDAYDIYFNERSSMPDGTGSVRQALHASQVYILAFPRASNFCKCCLQMKPCGSSNICVLSWSSIGGG